MELVTAMADRMGIEQSKNPELAELAQDVLPEKVMEEMEEHERQLCDNEATALQHG